MNHRIMFVSCIVLLFTVAVSNAAPAGAAFTVDSMADGLDASPGDGTCGTAAGECTLRAAIQEANALVGADTIDVPNGTYILTIAGAGENHAAAGDLDIRDDLTLTGVGAASTIIDGGEIDRVFDVVSGTIEVAGVTIRNGAAITSGTYVGGGIFVGSGAALTLTNSTVADNRANAGGGIHIDAGTLNLIDSTVRGNSADEDVGLTNAFGGGIWNGTGTLMLSNSTVNHNQARAGAGIWSSGTLTLTNSTVSSNIADVGSGIRNQNGAATLTNVTVANNMGGAAISHFTFSGTDAVTLKNTIVANSSGGNCTGDPITSDGHNLDDDGSCGLTGPGDLSVTDPQLGPLADNGGPTQTHALLPGSPAIDAGDDAGCPATDQRGVARPADGDGDGRAACDIGAYELEFRAAPTPTNTLIATITPAPTRTPTPSATPMGPSAQVVNTTDDNDDGMCDGDHCSLREAISAANDSAGPDAITFDISPADPGYNAGGWWTIRPATELPDLTDDNTTIDGTTQTANRGDTNPLGPEIELDGSLTGEDGFGIDIRSSNNLVRGLIVNRFEQDGVRIAFRDISGNRIVGNYIGTDARGQASLGNRTGVTLDSGPHDNLVGGDAPDDRNLISGNQDRGVAIFRANGNRVVGNLIGTNAAETGILGNGEAGLTVAGGSEGNVVGPANHIAYNAGHGVRVSQSGTTGNNITRNRIHSNVGKGILLYLGGNDELAPPMITASGATQAAGTACSNCTVEVFSDAEDEGAIYEGTTTADGIGNWAFNRSGWLTGPNVTATATDAAGNTSEFSAPVVVWRSWLYLPLILEERPDG